MKRKIQRLINWMRLFPRIAAPLCSVLLLLLLAATAPRLLAPVDPPADTQPVIQNYADLKWDKMIPELGESSPEICILHVDSKTQATKLLIRTPRGIHLRPHWHGAGGNHTMIRGTATFACAGKRFEQGPGSFNHMPAQTVLEAWPPAGALVFITTDGPWDLNWVAGPPTAADLTQ